MQNKIKVILFDLSRTLLFTKDRSYDGYLNPLHGGKLKELGDNYFLFDYFELNEELIEMVSKLKDETGLRFAIFTSGHIQEYPELKEKLVKYFDPILAASELKVSKEDSSTYSIVAKKLNMDTSEVLFVDDVLKNVEAAVESGMRVVQYDGLESIEAIKKELGVSSE